MTWHPWKCLVSDNKNMNQQKFLVILLPYRNKTAEFNDKCLLGSGGSEPICLIIFPFFSSSSNSFMEHQDGLTSLNSNLFSSPSINTYLTLVPSAFSLQHCCHIISLRFCERPSTSVCTWGDRAPVMINQHFPRIRNSSKLVGVFLFALIKLQGNEVK